MSQESGDTYYQGTQFRIVKDDKGKASDIEWAEDAYYQSEEFKKIEAAQSVPKLSSIQALRSRT